VAEQGNGLAELIGSLHREKYQYFKYQAS